MLLLRLTLQLLMSLQCQGQQALWAAFLELAAAQEEQQVLLVRLRQLQLRRWLDLEDCFSLLLDKLALLADHRGELLEQQLVFLLILVLRKAAQVALA